MSVPLYVPVLPTRPHAAATYRALAPDLQRQVAPLWTLPPRPGMLPKPLAERIAKEAGDISTAQRLGSGWLDAPFADEDEAAVLADVLTPGWWDHRNMRPVTGPGRPGAQQLLALAAARHREDGLGVRVRLPDDWNDLGRRRASRPDAHRPPRRPVPRPRHRPARPPRRCQGGCASPGHPDPAHVLAHGDRHGRMASPNRPTTSGRASRTRPRVRTGRPGTRSAAANARTCPDCATATTGSNPATYVTQTPPARGGGPPWGILRYTTARSYHLSKVPHGKQYDDANRQAARCFTGLVEFRGSKASAGRGGCGTGPGVP